MKKDKDTFQQTLVIKPCRRWIGLDFSEIWGYRELLLFLVLRDIKVRYKQTILGVTWAIIQPVMMMVVFSLFFGRFIKVYSSGVPYPLFTYAALLPWVTFTESISRSVNSLVQDANLVKKIYFPRLIMPLAGVLSPWVDFAFSFVVFLGLMLYFGIVPTIKIIFLPVFILLEVGLAFGVSLWLSALNVLYRDVRYAVPFILQFWFFSSPVVYASESLPSSWRLFYNLNPMVVVIDGFRWVLLAGNSPFPQGLFIALASILLILLAGLFYFRRMERLFADIV